MRGEKFGRGRVAEHTGHVQDDAASALLDELTDRGAIREHDGFQIEVEGVVEAFIGEFVQRAVAFGASAAARDMVEGIEPIKHRHRPLSGLRCGGISSEPAGLGTEFGQSGIDIRLRAAGDDHVRPSGDEFLRRGEAEAGGAADNDHVLALEGMHGRNVE